jgi:cytochrome c biogenesis protein CcdA
MPQVDRPRLVRCFVVVGLLVLTALLLTACGVDYYQLGEFSGRISREIVERLKAFWQGFVSGFGGKFCIAPMPAMILGLSLALQLRHKS